ncbi:hypothetical protein BZA70DRAFT_22480 [Myxozyma melibiosi]|uniref:Uncharacterized protein n=1 Tax=Myxozyma melibiosi TaxID=54550 RepID=A0ABR1FD13_9ASCO
MFDILNNMKRKSMSFVPSSQLPAVSSKVYDSPPLKKRKTEEQTPEVSASSAPKFPPHLLPSPIGLSNIFRSSENDLYSDTRRRHIMHPYTIPDSQSSGSSQSQSQSSQSAQTTEQLLLPVEKEQSPQILSTESPALADRSLDHDDMSFRQSTLGKRLTHVYPSDQYRPSTTWSQASTFSPSGGATPLLSYSSPVPTTALLPARPGTPSSVQDLVSQPDSRFPSNTNQALGAQSVRMNAEAGTRFLLPEPRISNNTRGANHCPPQLVSYGTNPIPSRWDAIELPSLERDSLSRHVDSAYGGHVLSKRNASPFMQDRSVPAPPSGGDPCSPTASNLLHSDGGQISYPHSRTSSAESQYASASSTASNPISQPSALRPTLQVKDGSALSSLTTPANDYRFSTSHYQFSQSSKERNDNVELSSIQTSSQDLTASSSQIPANDSPRLISSNLSQHHAGATFISNNSSDSSFSATAGRSSSGLSGHPAIHRLGGVSESLQQRRPARSTLSLSRLTGRHYDSVEDEEMNSRSPCMLEIGSDGHHAGSPSPTLLSRPGNSEQSFRSRSSSSNASPTVNLSATELSTAVPVDDSCSKCGIRASVLVEYTKVKEELQAKKKQWEFYFAEDHMTKSKLREDVLALKANESKALGERDILIQELTGRLEAQQRYIDELLQKWEIQRDKMSHGGGDAATVDVKRKISTDSAKEVSAAAAAAVVAAASVNSPPTTTEGSTASVASENASDLSDDFHDATYLKNPKMGPPQKQQVELDVSIGKTGITSEKSQAQESGGLSVVDCSVGLPFEVTDQVLDPVMLRRKGRFTSRSPFPAGIPLKGDAKSKSYPESGESGKPVQVSQRPGRKHRQRLLFDGSNLKSLHVQRVGRFGKKIEEDDTTDPFGLMPKNAVPVLKDFTLGFREGVVDSRSKRLRRGMVVYKVGRKIPGELI